MHTFSIHTCTANDAYMKLIHVHVFNLLVHDIILHVHIHVYICVLQLCVCVCVCVVHTQVVMHHVTIPGTFVEVQLPSNALLFKEGYIRKKNIMEGSHKKGET